MLRVGCLSESTTPMYIDSLFAFFMNFNVMIFLTIFLNYLLNWGCQLAVVGWVIALANIRINPNQFLSYRMSLNEYIFANLR